VEIRALDPDRDRPAVRDFYRRAADYVRLETGAEPDEDTLRDFFEGVPPGGNIAESAKLGLFADDGRLAAIADLAFGFPEPGDAFIGLLLVDPADRGAGLGPTLLERLEQHARARGAPRLLLAVLDANPRGRAFWEREGFRVVLTTPPRQLGRRTHVLHRMQRALDSD
jgi:GNAT superfamily N-acetyltransferase